MTAITDCSQVGRLPSPAIDQDLEIAMTAALIAPEIAGTHVFGNELTPRLVVVLVAPTGALPECDAAIENLVLAGAITVACEVDTDDDMLATALSTVLRTVDDASALRPGLPVVLVGHAEARGITSLAAEACGDDLAGLVMSDQHGHSGPTSRAA
ncbi:hypothetical protein D0Z08_03770 [Nocardioides immobilis]|uniref:Uncharacterized protein n=2 Tax=Nocardioides immobilis TaxID=2049295 RepID=A0A417Y5Z2_9ACTN|nr:hypothetical protein D0Z08_03770 [Nocardioides immobilis]